MCQGVDICCRFCKPLDSELLKRLAKEHPIMISVEEGAIGGFASHGQQLASPPPLLPIIQHLPCNSQTVEKLALSSGSDLQLVKCQVVFVCWVHNERIAQTAHHLLHSCCWQSASVPVASPPLLQAAHVFTVTSARLASALGPEGFPLWSRNSHSLNRHAWHPHAAHHSSSCSHQFPR